MAKVLMVGDSPHLHTGFARVMREIANGLLNVGHEVKVIGWLYQGEPHDLPYQIISPLDHVKDYYGIQQTRTIIEMWKPDVLFSLGDPWMIDWIPEIPERKNVKWIGYFPIDGVPLPKAWIPIIEDMDVPVLYSQFGYDLVKEAISDKDLKLILHGVDTDVFYPLPKEDIDDFKINSGLDGKWVVSCVARNQWRKNLPALFKAFGEFAKDKEDVALYYHGATKDVGWNILELIDRNSLQGKVFYMKEITANKGVPNHVLNIVYNMSDLTSIPFLGEGFGLPIAESLACGTPVLVTDFSTTRELTTSEHERIKVACMYSPPGGEKGITIDYALVEHNDYVEKLNWFYNNRDMAKQIGEEGRTMIVEKLQWKDKVDKFMNLFEETINEK